jgi:hypothetical protein
MIGHVVCLDNNPKSLAKYLPIIERHNLQPEVFTRPMQLGNFCDDLKNKHEPSSVKAFVLDMHDLKIRNLSEINLPKVSTLEGLAVGFAVAEQYLRKPDSVFRSTPIALLTGYGIPKQITGRVEKLKKSSHFEILEKPTGLDQFERFIEKITGPLKNNKRQKIAKKTKSDPIQDVDEDFILDIREGVDIVIKMLDELQFSASEKAAALGYGLKNADGLLAVIRRAKARVDVDMADRIDSIIEIKSKLDALSEDNPTFQRNWLRQRERFLGNKSPIDLIRSRHLGELIHVLALIENATG